MGRMMHTKNNKYLQTRRDMTIRQIQDNVYSHNDPIGEGIVFQDFMQGQKTTISQPHMVQLKDMFIYKRNSEV
jgi:hypothetical protein